MNVKVKLSKKSVRLVKMLRKVPVRAIVSAHDVAGNSATISKPLTLKPSGG